MFVISSIKIEENNKEMNIISSILYHLKMTLYHYHNKFLTFLAHSIDKIYHSFEYFIFYLLLFIAFKKSNNYSDKKNMIISTIIVVFVGIIDELHQRYVPTRFCSITDFIADITGMLIMLCIIYISIVYRRKNEN